MPRIIITHNGTEAIITKETADVFDVFIESTEIPTYALFNEILQYNTEHLLAKARKKEPLFLFLISQNIDTKYDHYDNYDSAIVCATNTEEARRIHPDGKTKDHRGDWTAPKNVQVKLIGEASEDIKPGVVLASYRAG